MVKSKLSYKLMLVFFGMALILSISTWLYMSRGFKENYDESIRPYLRSYVKNIERIIGYPPNIRIAEDISLNLAVDIIVEGKDHTIFWRSKNSMICTRSFKKISSYESNGQLIEEGSCKNHYCMRFNYEDLTTTIIMYDNIIKKADYKLFFFMIITLFICLITLYFFIHKLFSPIKKINEAVKDLGDGGVVKPLSINREDELGLLAKSVNKTAKNIEDMLETKRQLLLAISHELRTPITRSKIALSLMDENNAKASIEEDLTEMENLIHELLESERLKGKHAILDIECCNINDIIQQVEGRYFENELLSISLAKDIPCMDIDPKRISLVIKNIINNALNAQKNKKTPVLIRSEFKNNLIVVSVKDYGVGIKEENIPKVTEPFYRVDSSRQRKTGGFGIGLHLIKLTIEAHGGNLSINSKEGVGTTVSFSLPLGNCNKKSTRNTL